MFLLKKGLQYILAIALYRTPVELTSALVVALDGWTGEVEPINILMPIRNPYETTSAQLMMRGINRSKTDMMQIAP